MQKFDLSLWLQDKSRKVITRLKKLVQIISIEGKEDIPIVALVEGVAHQYKPNGYHADVIVPHTNQCCDMGDYDLFFADEEEKEELSEFEKELQIIISEASHWTSDDGSISTYCLFGDKEIKKISAQILDLARKETEKENSEFKPKFTYNEKDYSKLANKLIEFRNNVPLCSVVYRDGEGRKVILHYEKEILDLARNEIFQDLPKWKNVKEKSWAGTKDYKIIGYYLVKGDYAIYLENLDKLPKE